MKNTQFIFAITAASTLLAHSVIAEEPAPATAGSAATDKVTLEVIKVDSEETDGEDGKGANAVDGDPNTFWHTKWQDESPACPHEIVIKLSRKAPIKGITHLPRQDDSENGRVKEYEIYVSEDGQDFGKPVKTGTLEAGNDKQTIAFDAKPGQFIKLKAISEINGEAWTSIAEIGVVLAEDGK